MAAGGEGGYHYHLNIARGRGREYHYTPAGGGGGYPNPQIPAGGGGGYPKPQIPAEGGYPNPQIPAGGGGGYPRPQIPAEGGYPNPQIPGGGGGGYPKPQIPAEGGYPNPQIPGGGGGGYPKPQIPAEGGYPNPQIPAGGEGGGGGCPNPQIPAGGIVGGHPDPQLPAGGRGRQCHYPQIPGGGGGGYPYHQIQVKANQEERFECESTTWYKIPIYMNEGILRLSSEINLDPETCHILEEAYQQKLYEVSFRDNESGSYYTASLEKNVLYLTGNHLPLAHLKRVKREANRVRNTASDRSVFSQASSTNKDPSKTKEGQMMVEKYKNLASSLFVWLNSAMNWIMQIGVPTTLMEIKAVLVTIGRFRAEEVPTWVDTRKEIFRIFNNLQNYGVSPLTIDESISPSKINFLWTKLESALLFQQVTLQREIDRLEGVHLLERIEKEAHHLEGRLDNLEHVLGGEGRQHNAAKSTEGKEKSVLDGELKDIDNHVASLVNHLLMAGFSDVHPVYNRVLCIRRRAGNMQTALHNNATQKPPPGPSANKVLMTAQYQQSYNGAQMVESTNALQHVKFCFQWINNKHALLEGAEYGDSIDWVKQALDQNQKEHQEIISFKTEVDKCVTDMKKLTLEEQQPYEEWLSHVQLMYPVLHKFSCQRQECLVSLQVFLQEATAELIWMHEKKQLVYEYSRRLDEFSIQDEQIYKNLMLEITNRKSQIKSVQDRGYTMIIDKHPATEIVEVYISRTESRWSWLQQLLNCLDKHIRDICAYHQFFQEVQSCEQWINRQTEIVNNYMKLETIPFNKLEQMKIECQDLQNALVEYEEKVAFLAKTSPDIIPLKQRNHQVTSSVKAYSLCIYEHPKISLQLHEECSLIDTSQKSHWVVIQEAISYLQSKQSPTNKFTEFLVHRVLLCEVIATTGSIEFFTHTANNVSTLVILEYMRSTEIGLLPVINSHGQQVTVPSICMMIPPPNLEAISHADRLKTLLEQLKTLVKTYDRKLTENIVMSTIKFIKTWDLGMSFDPTTCLDLVRDLNDGAAKLIAEAGDADQKMQKQLKKDLDECNRKVQKFSKKLSEEVCEEREPNKTKNTAVDRGQSPQTSDINKPNVTKKVPNQDTESTIPQTCQNEFPNAWRNKVEGTSALTPEKTDVPGSYPSKTDLSEVDQEDFMAYIECKMEVGEDVLNSIKITYGQKGIDSLISDLDQFAKVDVFEGRVLVLCDYKHAENVQRCVKSHYDKVRKERKTADQNKHLINGGNDNLMEWLRFAYGHSSWIKNLQLEGDKLYLTGTLQMKKEVEKAVHSMNYWYQQEFAFTSEEQQKADEVSALVKNELPAVFIKQTKETMIVLSDNRDNFERANYKVKVALGRIKITARGRGSRDPQLYSGMSKEDKMDANPKRPSSGFQSNQPTADLALKSYCTKEGLMAKVYLGNITSLPVDCIVNAANGLLSHGGGVAQAISKAAGEDFDQEGEEYVRKNGPVQVTQCCVTSAGRLPYKFVIHAVGPQWSDYKDNEKDRCIDDLKKTIVSCMIKANKFKMASIAIPPLSSGIFGVPKDLCTQMYAKGVVEYSKTYGLQSVKEIHFVDTNSEMCQLTQSAFDKELQCG